MLLKIFKELYFILCIKQSVVGTMYSLLAIFMMLYSMIQIARKKHFLKKIVPFFLIWYVTLIFIITVFSRETQEIAHYNIRLFWSYSEVLKTGNTFLIKSILQNIILLFPIGFLMSIYKEIKWNYILTVGFLVSLMIEILQLILKKGMFELDDLVHNTTGVFLGVVLYKLLQLLMIKISEKKKDGI